MNFNGHRKETEAWASSYGRQPAAATGGTLRRLA
jgi:hypothetical protein